MNTWPLWACTSQKSSKNATEAFYKELHQTLQNIPKKNRLVLLGDSWIKNKRGGWIWQRWQAWIRKNWRKWLSAGRSMQIAQERVSITNNFFKYWLKRKASWIYPRSKHGHTVDNVTVMEDILGREFIQSCRRGEPIAPCKLRNGQSCVLAPTLLSAFTSGVTESLSWDDYYWKERNYSPTS